jgi:hypothetical protein
MVAAILLQKKRLVDILEEACDLDPLNVAAGAAGGLLDAASANGLGVVDVANSPTTGRSSKRRRRNSAASRSNGGSTINASSLYLSSSFASDSSSTETRSGSSTKVRFSTSPPHVKYFSNYLPSMTEKEREQVRTSIWYTVRWVVVPFR